MAWLGSLSWATQGFSRYICDSCFESDLNSSETWECQFCSNFTICLRCQTGASSHVRGHVSHRCDGGLASADVLVEKELPDAALRRGASRMSFLGIPMQPAALQRLVEVMRELRSQGRGDFLEEVSFRRSGINEDGILLVAEMLKDCNSLRSLDLSMNHFVDIPESLLRLQIVMLDLSQLRLLQESFDRLCDVLKTHSTLKVLQLRRVGLGSLLAVDKLALILKENKTLESFRIGINFLCGPHIQKITDALISANRLPFGRRLSLRGRSKINHLELSETQLTGDDLVYFSRVFAFGIKLRRLELGGNSVGPAAMQDFLQKLAQSSGLEELSINLTRSLYFRWISEPDEDREYKEGQMATARALAEALRTGQPSQNLHLRHCGFIVASAEIFADGLRDAPLKNLQLDNVSFEHNAVDPILRVLGSCKLTTLNMLRSTQLTTEQVEKLADCAAESTTLEFLRLGEYLPAGTGRAFARFLLRNRSLKSLYLSHCFFELGEGCDIAEALMEVYGEEGEKHKLRALALYECNLGTEDVSKLCQIAARNETNLDYLNLGGNNMDEAVIQRLAGAMEDNHKIQTLILSSVGIFDSDVPALRSLLAANSTIQHLAVHHNVLSVVGAVSLWFDYPNIVETELKKNAQFVEIADFAREQGLSILNSLPERILEIRDQEEQLRQLRTHIERFKHGVGSLKQAKVLVVGAGNAGKTSLCNCIMEGAWEGQPVESGSSRATIGVIVKQKSVINSETEDEGQLFLWDFGGQEDYFMTHSFFLSRRSVIVVVVDLEACDPDDEQSFEFHVGQWLRALQAQVTKPKVILVGTKADLVVAKTESKKGFDPVAAKMDSLRKQIITMNEDLRAEMDKQRVRMETKRGATSTEEYRRVQTPNALEFFASSKGSLGFTTSFENRSSIEDFVRFLTEVCTDPKYGIVLSVPKDVETLSNGIQRVEHKAVLDKTAEARSIVPDVNEIYFEQALELLHDIGQIVWLKNDARLNEQVFIRPQWIVDVFASVLRHDMFGNKEARPEEGAEAKLGFIHRVRPKVSEHEIETFRVFGVLTRTTLLQLWRTSTNVFLRSMSENDFNLVISLLLSLGLVSDSVPASQKRKFPDGEQLYFIPFYCRTEKPEEEGSTEGKMSEKKARRQHRKERKIEKLEYVYEFFTYMPHGLFTRLVATSHLILDEAYQSRFSAMIPRTDSRIVAFESRQGVTDKGDDLQLESTIGQSGRGRIVLIGELPMPSKLSDPEESRKKREEVLECLQDVREHFESLIATMFRSVPYRSYIVRNYLGKSVVIPVYELQSLLISGFLMEKVKLFEEDKPTLRETLHMYLAKQDPRTGFFILPDHENAKAEEIEENEDEEEDLLSRSEDEAGEARQQGRTQSGVDMPVGSRRRSFWRDHFSLSGRKKKKKQNRFKVAVPVELIAPNATLLIPASDTDAFGMKKAFLRALKALDERRLDARYNPRILRALAELETQIMRKIPGGMSDINSLDPLRDAMNLASDIDAELCHAASLGEEVLSFRLQNAVRIKIDILRRLVTRIRLPYDVFLSHTWGKDAVGRNNHKRVGIIARELQRRGVNCFYDNLDSSLGDTGRTGLNLSKGIPQSEVALVCLTDEFISKIESSKGYNNAQREFQFIKHMRPGADTLLVAMEPNLQVSDEIAGSQLLLDLSLNDPDAQEEVDAQFSSATFMNDDGPIRCFEDRIGSDEEDNLDWNKDDNPDAWPTVAPLREQLLRLEGEILEKLFPFDESDLDLLRQLLEFYPSSGRQGNENTRGELNLD